MAGAGHFPHLQAPETVVRLARDFSIAEPALVFWRRGRFAREKAVRLTRARKADFAR
jgi:hypothetical protein